MNKKTITAMVLAAMMINCTACGAPVETVPEAGETEQVLYSMHSPEHTIEDIGLTDGQGKKLTAPVIIVPAAEATDVPAEPPVLTLDDLIARTEDPAMVADMEAWFADTLFIGDSRTVGLERYAGLESGEFFALTGMSVFDAFKNKAKLDPEAADGSEILLEELLTTRQFGKIYIMLGINELGYNLSSIEKKYEEVVQKVMALQPEAEVILQANMHVTKGRSEKDPIFNNTTINTLNGVIEAIAQRNGTGFIDVNPVFDDEEGHLSQGYTFDHTHIIAKYYKYWTMWIYSQGACR